MMGQIERYFLIIMLLGLAACGKRADRSLTGDNDLQLQVSQIIDKNDAGEISLKVRLIPSRRLAASVGKENNLKLQFSMDSCFYEMSGAKTKYPVMVQNVNNGQKGNYEYLVAFEPDKNKRDSLFFFYKDRFLDKKTYNVKIPLSDN